MYKCHIYMAYFNTATGVYKMCDRQPRLGAKASLLALVHKWVNLIKVFIFKGIRKTL